MSISALNRLRIFFAISVCVSPCVPSRGADDGDAGSGQRRYTIANCVSTYDPARARETRAGSEFWFIDKTFADGKTVKLSVVAPGKATHSSHRHDEDEVFFILEGRAVFFLDGETVEVGPMTSLYCPSGHEHGIRNAGDTDLKYLVIKRYPPPVPVAP